MTVAGMKQTLGLAASILGLLAASAAPAAADPFGMATNYNVFVLGSMTLSNTAVGGRVAVGGAGQFTNFAVGSGNNGSNGIALSADASRLDLIVGGSAVLTNGSIQRGSAYTGGAVQQTGVGYPVAGAGQTSGPSPVDFASAGADLRQQADWLASFTANGNVSRAYSTLTLQGTDAALNVFNLTLADLTNLSTLNLFAPVTSTVIVNVAGAAVNLANMGLFINNSQNSAMRQNVLWNFSQASSLSLSGLQWSGSILAPSAAMTFNNGQINGQVAVQSLNATGAFHNFQFTGRLPDPTPAPIPEPSTLLLTLSGGFVALRKLRQRRARA